MLEYRRRFYSHTYTDRHLLCTTAKPQHTTWMNRCKWLLHRREIGEMASCCANRHSCQSKCSGGPCVLRTSGTASSDASGAVWRYRKIHRLVGTFPSRTQFQASATTRVTLLQPNLLQLFLKKLPRFSEAITATLYLTSLTNQRWMYQFSLFISALEVVLAGR